MSAELTSMLSYRMRRLAAKHGDGQQLQDAIKQLLEGERGLKADGQFTSGENAVRLPGRPLQALPQD
jgi:hypothetical protein